MARLSPLPQELPGRVCDCHSAVGPGRAPSGRAATREGRCWGPPAARPDLHSTPEAGWWPGGEAVRTVTAQRLLRARLPAAQPSSRANIQLVLRHRGQTLSQAAECRQAAEAWFYKLVAPRRCEQHVFFSEDLDTSHRARVFVGVAPGSGCRERGVLGPLMEAQGRLPVSDSVSPRGRSEAEDPGAPQEGFPSTPLARGQSRRQAGGWPQRWRLSPQWRRL